MRRWAVGISLVLAACLVVWAAVGFPLPFEHSSTPPEAISSESGVRGLIVEPDDGRSPILDEITAATSTIDVMIYLLTDSAIVDSLIDAEARGVEVRVILEQHPYGGFGNPEEVVSKLRATGAEVMWSSSAFTFTHAKMLIFDRSVVAILNLNLTRSSFTSNREFGILSTWSKDVSEANTLFDADWSGTSPKLKGSLVISPVNSRESILALIADADTSIDIYAEVIRDDEFVRSLVSAEARGVEVRILLSPDTDVRWTVIAGSLDAAGVEVRLSTDLYVHAKAIVVDHNVAYVGSENFTATSLDENREVGIVISEPELLSRIERLFAYDFSSAAMQS